MAGDFDRIRSNVQRMINLGAPEGDIDGYLETEGLTASTFRELVSSPTGGFFEGLKGSTKRMLSSGRTALTAPLFDSEAAGEAGLAGLRRQEQIKERPGASLEEVKRKFEEGFIPGVKEVVSQVPGAIGEFLPQAGSMLATGRLGAMAGAPFGPVGATVGGIGGALLGSFLPQTGSDIERQAQEDIKAGRPVDVSMGKALGAGAGQAALDYAGLALGGVGRFLGIPMKKLGTETAEKMARESILKAGTKGTAQFIAGELPTEIAQQMLERYQADLPLTTPDALQEYYDVAYQTALMAPAGGGARVLGRPSLPSEPSQPSELSPLSPTPVTTPLEQGLATTAALTPEVAPTEAAVPEIAPVEGVAAPTEVALPEEVAPEIAVTEPTELAPLTSLPNVIDDETIQSFGFKPRTIAYKRMQEIDPTTPEGQELFDKVIENNARMVKTDENIQAVNQFKSLIAEHNRLQEVPSAGADIRAVGTSIRVPGEPTDTGRAEVTGEPIGGGVAEYRADLGRPEARTEPEYGALEPVVAEEFGLPVAEKATIVAPEATEVLPTAEEMAAPEIDKEAVRKDAFRVATQLKRIDPYHPSLDTLRSEYVTPEDVEAARADLVDLEETATTGREAAPMEEAALTEVPEVEGEDEIAQLEKAKDVLGTYVRQKVGGVENIAPEDQVTTSQALAALADIMYYVVKSGVRSMGEAITRARRQLGENAKHISREQFVEAYNQANARVAETPSVTPETDLDSLYMQAGGREAAAAPDTGPLYDLKNDPKEFVKQRKRDASRFLDELETMWFSFDAGLQKALRAGMEDMGAKWDNVRDMLYKASTAQALHREGVAHQFLEQGSINYDPTLYKYVVSKGKASWADIIKTIKKAADKYNVPFEKMQAYANQALIAKRLEGLKRAERDVYIHLNDNQIKAGLELFKRIPELNEVTTQWNEVRENVLKFATDSGLYDAKTAQELLDVMDYVPFYRVEQLVNRAGPKEYTRGLLDAAKDKRFKGSEKEINNVFDNMERWISYVIGKGINNRTAQNLADAAVQYLPEEVREVKETNKGMEQNTVSIWRDGKLQKYEFDDPLFIHAFTGIESIALPGMGAWSKFSNFLRQNIVLNPLFSVGQLSQDAFGAMFTSGVKNPFAIPGQVVSEFVKTLSGTSIAHSELKQLGAVGIRDYSSEVSRLDAEIAAEMKKPGLVDRALGPLRALSMASDNAVRQAVYNQTLKETGDKALAIERAFEVINFRRAGAGKATSLLRQTVPFFGAYLQAMNVAYKVLSGRGVAPSQKAEARKVLASTFTKVMVLGLIYNAMVSDDDEYKKLDPAIRDRHLIIPGTDGLMLPLRSDLFTFFAKIVPEHIYQMTMAEGTEDGTKAAKALKEAFANAVLSPNVTPQALKPLAEISLNRNFYTGRPVVGMGVENLDPEKQYSANTSEFSKMLGGITGTSPMKWDHVIKAYVGYTGGTLLMATDNMLADAAGTPRPDKSVQDMIASIPGMSAFVAREFGTRDINDFYELRDSVSKAVNTFNYMKKFSTPEETRAYAQEKQQLLSVKSQVNRLNELLSTLREQERRIAEAPESRMSAEEKGNRLRAIQERKQMILKNVSRLRQQAGL